MLKDWLSSDVKGVPGPLQEVKEDAFIHGWLMFDPLYGFIMDDSFK